MFQVFFQVCDSWCNYENKSVGVCVQNGNEQMIRWCGIGDVGKICDVVVGYGECVVVEMIIFKLYGQCFEDFEGGLDGVFVFVVLNFVFEVVLDVIEVWCY